MTSSVNVDIKGMRDAANAIESLNRRMNEKYSGITQEIKRLRSSWEGTAANEAQSATTKMDPKLAKFQDAVKDGIRALRLEADKWEGAETQAVQGQISAKDQYSS